MSKITGITIVNQQGTSEYFVGRGYNGLILDRIYDNTISGDDVHVPHFIGYTSCGQPVFEVINAPIEVVYSSDA
jgi:hypothetical protein